MLCPLMVLQALKRDMLHLAYRARTRSTRCKRRVQQRQLEGHNMQVRNQGVVLRLLDHRRNNKLRQRRERDGVLRKDLALHRTGLL